MRSKLGKEEGKGVAGCVVSLLLFAVAIYVGVKIFPTYYAHKSLETDVKNEVSRAGAHFHQNEGVLKNILRLAERNEVRLKRENVKVERFAGQIHVTIRYTVPIDLIFYHHGMDFEIKASSFVGRL